MTHHRAWIALLAILAATEGELQAQSNTRDTAIVTVRPSMLAAGIEELAGAAVRVQGARVVGVFNPQALVIDTANALPAVVQRGRLLVLVDDRELKVPSTLIVGSTVVVVGVARTVVGMQVSREVPWPPEITPDLVKRLEIRAAVLASSVRSADGVELTSEKPAAP